MGYFGNRQPAELSLKTPGEYDPPGAPFSSSPKKPTS